jgi:hypothetical protein
MKLAATLTASIVAFSLAAPARAQWSQTHGPEAGRVTQISVNPADGHVFAIGSESLFRSRDGGATWTPLFNGLSGNVLLGAVTASGSVAYLVGYPPNGTAVYRSIDDGDSWTAMEGVGLPVPAVIRSLLVDGSTLFAALDDNAVYASTDNGDHWAPMSSGIPATASIAFFATRGTEIYAGTSIASPTQGIYLSTDHGASWAPTSTPFLASTKLAGLSANANGVFASTSTQGSQRSLDQGTTWQKMNPGGLTNFGTVILATNANVFVGLGSTFGRTDANGDNWTLAGIGMPPPNAGLAVSALAVSGTSVLAGVGAFGVYRTISAGDSWARSNDGLVAGRIDGLYAEGSRVFAAVNGVGFYRTGNHGDAWTEINNGITPYVGGYGFAKTGSTLLGGAGNTTLWRSDDDGDLWTSSNDGLSLTGTLVLRVEATTPATVYGAGYYGVVRSVDSGLTWTTLNTGFTTTETVFDLWKDGAYILAGANSGLKRSYDSGNTWNAPVSGLPGGASVLAFAQLVDTLYAATSLGVYKSEDNGETWESSNTGITGTPAALLTNGSALYAGTTSGVFVSTDRGANWAPVNVGFPPNLSVTELATDGTTLYAGTFRNGVWQRPISQTPVLASLVSAEATQGRVRISWYVPIAGDVGIERRQESTEWARVGTLAPDGGGYLNFEDPNVEPGMRYGYRLWIDDGARAHAVGETWIEVPADVSIRFEGAGPNPTSGVPTVAFAIPSAGRVTLELFDTSGRRVGNALQAEFSAGRHVLPLGAWGRLAPGVYGVQLRFGAERRSVRIVVTR